MNRAAEDLQACIGAVLRREFASAQQPEPPPRRAAQAATVPQSEAASRAPTPQERPPGSPAEPRALRAATGRAPSRSRRPPAPVLAAGAGAAGPGAHRRPGQKLPASRDRLELGTATVTGDREQPKVMYIVPWKKSDIGDLAGKPMNSLVDEILAPVDRDVVQTRSRLLQGRASRCVPKWCTAATRRSRVRSKS